MIARKLIGIAASAALAVSPVAVAAAQAGPPVDASARSAAPVEGESALRGESTPVLIALILIVLFGLAVLSNNGDDPNNPLPPTSP